MIRAAISSLLMLVGILLALGAAGFNPDALPLLSSESSSQAFGIQRFLAPFAQPFILFYGVGVWLWAVFLAGAGLRLWRGISPKTLLLRFFAAHGAALLLAVVAAAATGDPSYGKGGVLGSLALSAMGGTGLFWLPFLLPALFLCLCGVSSLPQSALRRLAKAFRGAKPLPVHAPLRDTHEEQETVQAQTFESSPPLERPEVSAPPRLTEPIVPSFLRDTDVDLQPKDFTLGSAAGQKIYDKIDGNLIELDEAPLGGTPLRFLDAPEAFDETEGEAFFKIPAVPTDEPSMGGLTRPSPLVRLSFDAPPAPSPAEPIESAHARRQDPLILEEDDSPAPRAPEAPAEAPLLTVKTLPLAASAPPIQPEEEIRDEEGELIQQGAREDIDAHGIILPDDSSPGETAEPAPSEYGLSGEESSLIRELDFTHRQKEKDQSELVARLRRRQEELAEAYRKSEEVPASEDMGIFLDREIASLRSADGGIEDFFVSDPALEALTVLEEPLLPKDSPFEALAEPLPLETETADEINELTSEDELPLELPPIDFENPELSNSSATAEELGVFGALSMGGDAAYSLGEEVPPPPLPEAPKLSQEDVDGLVRLDDKVRLDVLIPPLQNASHPSPSAPLQPSEVFVGGEISFSEILPPGGKMHGELFNEARSPLGDSVIWQGEFPAPADTSPEPAAQDYFYRPVEPSPEMLPQEPQKNEPAAQDYFYRPVEPSPEMPFQDPKNEPAAQDYFYRSLEPSPEMPFQDPKNEPAARDYFYRSVEPSPEGSPWQGEFPPPPADISPDNLSSIETLEAPFYGHGEDEENSYETVTPYSRSGLSLLDTPGEDTGLAPAEAALMPRFLRDEPEPSPSSIVHHPPRDPIFPSSDILTPNTDVIDPLQEDEEIETMIQTIEQAFESFNITMKVVDYSRGPSITRFELEPPSGLKLRTIRNLQDDIALQLGTSNIRIISPVEGRSYVGIEVPNTIRRSFMLQEFINDTAFSASQASLPLILGTDIGGTKVNGDLSALPHLLVAGTTGSGKSVYINALISGLLFKRSSDDLKFIMIDPKMVELELYNGIPHLLAPIITKPEEAMAALEWAVQEMDRRYRLLSDNGVRNIKEYASLAKNSLIGEESWEHLPYIVIIVDEFANLMLRSPKDTEKHISRLAAMARAVGMHLVVATQRPSVDVVTGVIKANFPCRIAFRVSSKIDSRTILDRNGAEALLGKGDMLYISPEYTEAERMQSPFVPGADVEAVVNVIKKNGPPNYVIDFEELLSKQDDDSDPDGSMTDALSDPLFAEVLRYAVDSGEVSASGIQRRFRVGYNRASRLIETLKDQRIISPPTSAGKGWQVLITKDQIINYID